MKGDEALAVANWVAKRIPGCERGFGPCVAMMVWDNGPIAGVVFHNYSPECGVIEMSSAAVSPRWLSKRVLKAIHTYIFRDAGCQLSVMRVSEKNKRMIRIAEAAGYTGHKIPNLRGKGEAEIIFTLADDDWFASKLSR